MVQELRWTWGRLFPKAEQIPTPSVEGWLLFIGRVGETHHPDLLTKLRVMAEEKPLHIVIYSDDSSVRNSLKSALGTRLASDMPLHEIHEFATGSALKSYVDDKKPVDLFILDGESTPEGGMGISRQFKDELFNCPPILVIIARKDDSWLAGWSRADGVLVHPIDPFTVAGTVASTIKRLSAQLASQ